MPRTTNEKKDANALDYLKDAYLRAAYSHPSTRGTDRGVAEANAREFALIVLRYTQDDSVRISVNDKALHKMNKRVEELWEMPHHREAKKDGSTRKKVVKKRVAGKPARKTSSLSRDQEDSSRPIRKPGRGRVHGGDGDRSSENSARAKLARMRARKKAQK